MSRDILRVSVNNQERHFHLLAPARPFKWYLSQSVLQGEDFEIFSILSEILTTP